MLPIDKELDITSFGKILDDVTTSYKLYWFAGVFNEVTLGNRTITFRQIVSRMIAKSWYSLLEFHLNLGIQDQLHQTVEYLHIKYSLPKDIKELDLIKFIELNTTDPILESKLAWFYRYVPYRLLAPFYTKALSGLKDADKNKVIATLSIHDCRGLYGIDVENKLISINDQWFKYLNYNQVLIDGWFSSKLVNFLQAKNPNVPAIPLKLNAQYKRNLTKAKDIWGTILQTKTINDIYTDLPLIGSNFEKFGSLSIDHFIPWSFVLHDQLWNLTPTFQRINSSKSDFLPEYDRVIDKFCEIQYLAFTTVLKGSKHKIEDYFNINTKLFLNGVNNISKEDFTDSLKGTIYPLYKIASNQGFRIWYDRYKM